jgi:hypothetical protein
MLSNGAVNREEALGMARRFEAAHGTFSVSGRLVRVFRLIMQALVIQSNDTIIGRHANLLV